MQFNVLRGCQVRMCVLKGFYRHKGAYASARISVSYSTEMVASITCDFDRAQGRRMDSSAFGKWLALLQALSIARCGWALGAGTTFLAKSAQRPSRFHFALA